MTTTLMLALQARSPLKFFALEVIMKFINALFCSQKRVSWRRLAVLMLGTGLLVAGMLASEQWLYLGLAYIAGDSAEKAMSAISKKS